MPDDMLAGEADVAAAIKRYVNASVAPRDARLVAAGVVARRASAPLRIRPFAIALSAAAVLFAVAVGGATLLTEPDASSPARAEVSGLTYDIAVARSLQISDGELEPYGIASAIDGGLPYDGTTVYAIAGVDPHDALVIPLRPGGGDDVGSYGNYALLVRGSLADVCPFFDPESDATPAECR